MNHDKMTVERRLWRRLRCACLVGLSLLLWGAELRAGEWVSVEKGDGIYKLLARHGIEGKEAHDEFIRINQGRLGPDNGLVLGQKYELPDTNRVVYQPLFGRELEKVTVVDDQLKGAALYLISGHGGPDTGAIGKENGHWLYEDEYAYDIVLRLGRRLIEHGAKVHFIIIDRNDGIRNERILRGNTTEQCYPGIAIPRNQRERLQQRCDAVNRLYEADKMSTYKRAISIHIDSRTSTQQIDTFFYHHRNSSAGRRLTYTMHSTFESNYQRYQPGRGYGGFVSSQRELWVVNHTVAPMAFIEVGNIQHEGDKERILDPDNRQAVANWLAEAVIEDFKKD